jgi:hypothetical protein
MCTIKRLLLMVAVAIVLSPVFWTLVYAGPLDARGVP